MTRNSGARCETHYLKFNKSSSAQEYADDMDLTFRTLRKAKEIYVNFKNAVTNLELKMNKNWRVYSCHNRAQSKS